MGLKRNRARWIIVTFLKSEEEKLSVDSKALSLGWPICQHPQEASGLHSLLISNLKDQRLPNSMGGPWATMERLSSPAPSPLSQIPSLSMNARRSSAWERLCR